MESLRRANQIATLKRRRKYMKTLAQDTNQSNYTQEEITKILERWHH